MAIMTVPQDVCDDCTDAAQLLPTVNHCARCGKALCAHHFTQTMGGGFSGVVLCVKCRYATEPEFEAIVDDTIAAKALAVAKAKRGPERDAAQVDHDATVALIADAPVVVKGKAK